MYYKKYRQGTEKGNIIMKSGKISLSQHVYKILAILGSGVRKTKIPLIM